MTFWYKQYTNERTISLIKMISYSVFSNAHTGSGHDNDNSEYTQDKNNKGKDLKFDKYIILSTSQLNI